MPPRVKTDSMNLGGEIDIPILYEDRSVLAIDKPAGWMLVPYTWDKTGRNLQLAVSSSILGREFWARSRNLKFLRHIHRLDAETTGILLFGKSQGAVNTYGDLFETRQMEKRYLAVVEGKPKESEWLCAEPIGPVPGQHGRMRLDRGNTGKEAETAFRLLETRGARSLIEGRPLTGRTHQIRLHLGASGLKIVGDPLYGSNPNTRQRGRALMGLRAVEMAYSDPFTRKRVRIIAPEAGFLQDFGFPPPAASLARLPAPAKPG